MRKKAMALAVAAGRLLERVPARRGVRRQPERASARRDGGWGNGFRWEKA